MRAFAWAMALWVMSSTATVLAAPVPIEDFVRRPKLERISFSPDGKKFAALGEHKGRMNVAVADVEKGGVSFVTSFEGSDVSFYRWISNRRLVFSLIDYQSGLADQDGGGLIAVDADGRNARRLSPTLKNCIDSWNFRCRYTLFWSTVPGSDDEIIALTNERSEDSPDLVRLDTRTGRKVNLTTDNPGSVAVWALDKDLVPRAAMSRDRLTLEEAFWYRDNAQAKWRRVASFPAFAPSFEPLGFAPDGTLYVSSRLESKDKAAIHRFDPIAGKPGEKLAAHPRFDLGLVDDPRGPGPRVSPLIFDSKTHELVGLQVEGDKPETVWLDARRARLQATVDAALPKGNVNRLRPVGDKSVLVLSYSGSDPGVYYLYDEDKRELRELARPRGWIKSEQMGTVEPIRYRARDGLEIQGYLTLPAGKPAKRLPLVAWIHGGPWSRDNYRWNPEVQFFASRGYAVLQPNYRGSTGLGLKHLTASFKQLGQAMQDDVTDGIRKLIADGIVDPDRVCIGGGSYGGYATMMGLVREPELFKCGINVVGVVDLHWWLDLGYTDFNLVDAAGAEAWLKRTVGDPKTDRAMMDAYSPRLHASKIKAPVLIVHGGNDMRVPPAHGEAMRDALKAAGKPVEWVLFPEEGHGFMKESNRLEYYRQMERFLQRHLGP
jgi:dipeptidyl aminopeptidase/acylaminoacyl peptidase